MRPEPSLKRLITAGRRSIQPHSIALLKRCERTASSRLIVPVDGGTPKNITNSPDASEYDAQWNHDGTKIGFLKQTVEGMNIYEYKGKVRFYILPRE